MNFFCRIFGHTWCPETRTPDLRWNTTKEGQVLVVTASGEGISHLDVCRRCGEERDAGARRLDSDHPEGQPDPLVGTLG